MNKLYNNLKFFFYNNFFKIFFIILLIISVIIILSLTNKKKKNTDLDKNSQICQESKKKNCQKFIKFISSSKNDGKSFNYDQCINSKQMTSFGCQTDNRIDFDTYCKAYNNLFKTEFCNKNNPAIYLQSSPRIDYWNNSYNCISKSKTIDEYGNCIKKIYNNNNLEVYVDFLKFYSIFS